MIILLDFRVSFPLCPVFPIASMYLPSTYFQYRICIGWVTAQNLTWFENKCSFSAFRMIHLAVFTFLDLYLCHSTVPINFILRYVIS